MGAVCVGRVQCPVPGRAAFRPLSLAWQLDDDLLKAKAMSVIDWTPDD